jgi:putative hydrolase
MSKMVLDTHTHTISSGHAYSTLQENCVEAAKKGLSIIAMTDHGPAMPGGPHMFHFGNLRVIPEVICGVEVLKGVEANVLDFDGRLDLDDRRLQKLDIVIASLHDVCINPGAKEENTRAIIGAMKNKYVDIIAHPGNPAFQINIDEVLRAAREYNVIIEINNSSLGGSRPGSSENCRTIAEKAAKGGNYISIGSDAHISYSVGEFSKAIEIIEAAGIDDEYIMNIHEDKIKNYLREKGKLKNRSI